MLIIETAVPIQTNNSQSGRLCEKIANYLYYRGRYEEAVSFSKQALEIRERVLGQEHQDTATSLNNLAFLYESQGHYEEAEALYKRAIEIRIRMLSPGHPDTTISLNNLADLYNNQGRYEEAEPLYNRVLELRVHLLGPDHPDTVNSLNNLAILYDNMGRYEDAEPLYKRALETSERALGPDHPETADSMMAERKKYSFLFSWVVGILAVCVVLFIVVVNLPKEIQNQLLHKTETFANGLGTSLLKFWQLPLIFPVGFIGLFKYIGLFKFIARKKTGFEYFMLIFCIIAIFILLQSMD